MTAPRAGLVWRLSTGLGLAVGLLVARVAWSAPPDALAEAKEFYAAADYERALATLGAAAPTISGPQANEAAEYRMFCLVALGRRDEAAQAIDAIVRADPTYHPSDADTSPRIRSFFEDVRRPLLPDVIKSTYEQAKQAFDAKHAAEAAAGFDRVLRLLEELGASDEIDVADVRTLARGFRDLAKASIPAAPTPDRPVVTAAPPPSPPPAPVARPQPSAATSPTVATAAERPAYGPADVEVVRPVAISRPLPPWEPTSAAERKRDFHGTIELLIDENGRVTSGTITASVEPAYDRALLDTVTSWRFQPATKGGVHVAYRLPLDIHLDASAR